MRRVLRGWRRGRGRTLVRLAALAVAIVVAAPLAPGVSTPKWLPAMSPFTGVASAIGLAATGDVRSPWAIVGMLLTVTPLLILAAIGRRLFCRWLCPMGVILDTVGITGHGKRVLKRTPQIGRAMALATWCGAFVGWPLFVWLDPLALFSALVGHGPYRILTLLAVLVIALGLLLPNLWCMKLCPLGATQDLIRTAALRVGRLFGKRRFTDVKDEEGIDGTHIASRRAWLETAVAAPVLLGIGYWGGRPRGGIDTVNASLRPPGAREEPDVWRLCLRCGNCMAACPTGIVRPDLESKVPMAFGAPVVVLENDGGHCLPTCNACTQVCPSGAISPLSVERKQAWSLGMAVVERELCVLTYGRECEICRRECPRDAVSFQSPDEGYTYFASIDPTRCNGCGACIRPCPGENTWEREADPTTPIRKAIRVLPLGDAPA